MSLTEKNSYWTRVIKDIERKARLQSKKDRIKNYDFAVTLPENLRKRVAKIMPYEFDEFDRNVFLTEVMTPTQVVEEEGEEMSHENKKESMDFNEVTGLETKSLEPEPSQFVVKIDRPLGHKAKMKEKHNWYSSYICKSRKERVKWDSKIYDLERGVWEKTLDEQAEELMDASAERFTEWINSLGSNRDSDISKEKLKALFSIEGDRKLLSSILIEPKEVKAFDKTVADKWNMAEMATELKYENYINSLPKNFPKKIDTVAFGRTIPVKERPWILQYNRGPIKTVYPEELLSFEKLFKGITHLRSTKELVEFYKQRPDLKKPGYLVSAGLFKKKEKEEAATEVPLYERLKLKY